MSRISSGAEAVVVNDEALIQPLEHGGQLLVLLKHRWCHRERLGEDVSRALDLTFNLLPGRGRIRGARHVGFAWEKVAGRGACAASFGPAGTGPGGFRDTGGGADLGADVAEPPADPAWG
jgi:hypothetical protein